MSPSMFGGDGRGCIEKLNKIELVSELLSLSFATLSCVQGGEVNERGRMPALDCSYREHQ